MVHSRAMEQDPSRPNAVAPNKKFLTAIFILVLGTGGYFLARGHFGSIKAALQEVIAGKSDATEIPLDDSSTSTIYDPSLYGETASVSYQQIAPAKAKKTTKQSSVGSGPENVLPKNTVTAASSSSAGSDLRSAPTSSTVASPDWCAWQSSTNPTSSIMLSETNKSWIGLKNNSEQDIETKGWQILSFDEKIKIKLADKKLEAGRSYHVKRSDAGDGADLKKWLELFNAKCDLIADVDPLRKDQAYASATTTVQIPPTTIASPVSSSEVPNADPTPGIDPNNSSQSSSSSSSIALIATTTIAMSTTSAPSSSAVLAASTSAAVSSPSSTPAPVVTSAPTLITSEPEQLVIAVIEIGGGAGSANRDLIKVYNPNGTAVDISGWKLRKRTSSGSEESVKVFPKSNPLPAKAYFTWANAQYTAGADSTSTQTLAADNSVALFDPKGNIMDAVAWGKGKDQYREGQAYPANPGPNKLLMRKFENGTIKDTNNNSADFEIE
jgi:hypothetical protein